MDITGISKVFSFGDEQLQVFGTDENPTFCVKDICKVLGIKNASDAVSKFPEKWKSMISIHTNGGIQNVLGVSEAGLYKLVMCSKKKIAQRFQEWVCEDVLYGNFRLQEYKDKLIKNQDEISLIQRESLETQKKNQEALYRAQEKIEHLTSLLPRQRRIHQEENVVYLITTEFLKKNDTYIIGRAVSFANRLSSYDKTCPHEVIHFRECLSREDMNATEQMILRSLFKYRDVSNHDRFKGTKQFFIDIIDSCTNFLIAQINHVYEQNYVDPAPPEVKDESMVQ